MGLANEARLHAFSSSTPPSHTRSADASAPAGRTKAHQAEESRSCALSWFSLHPGPSRSCERLSLRLRRGCGSRPKAGATDVRTPQVERGRSVGARAEVDTSARGRALVESSTSLPASPLVGRPGELACDFSKLPTLGAAGRCSSRFSLSSEFCRSGIRQANTRESRAAGTRSAFNPSRLPSFPSIAVAALQSTSQSPAFLECHSIRQKSYGPPPGLLLSLDPRLSRFARGRKQFPRVAKHRNGLYGSCLARTACFDRGLCSMHSCVLQRSLAGTRLSDLAWGRKSFPRGFQHAAQQGTQGCALRCRAVGDRRRWGRRPASSRIGGGAETAR